MSDSYKYTFGDVVYHKTDDKKGIIIGILQKPNELLYEVSWGIKDINYHYEFELQDYKPVNV